MNVWIRLRKCTRRQQGWGADLMQGFAPFITHTDDWGREAMWHMS